MTKMTKSAAKWIASLALIGGSLGGVANAAPVTWTDYINFTPDRYVGQWTTSAWTHDIRDGANGFKPGIDQVDSYSLSFNLYDDYEHRDIPEIAIFSQPGSLLDQVFFNLSGAESAGWSLSGVWRLETTGRITVSVFALLGDFYLGSSTLTVRGQSVPEPGTLALFGAALLGFGLLRRKRLS